MPPQLTLQRRGAPCVVAIMCETPFWGAGVTRVLIWAPWGPDSIADCEIFSIKLQILTSAHSLYAHQGLLSLSLYLDFKSILRATSLMATRFKATTPKCASGKVPGNTIALCADRPWMNGVLKAVPGTYSCTTMSELPDGSSCSFSSASHGSG